MMIIDKISQAALSADRPGYERTSSSLWKQREEYCAALIQRAWNEFQVGTGHKELWHFCPPPPCLIFWEIPCLEMIYHMTRFQIMVPFRSHRPQNFKVAKRC